jgi:Undecaprenyl-phosphate galactose phosphotransferase WbaP
MVMINRLQRDVISTGDATLLSTRDLATSARDKHRAGHAAALSRAALLIFADIAAFALALGLGGVIAGALSLAASGADVTGADTPFEPMALSLTTILSGILIYFCVKAHYQRRLMFWTEARQVLSASVIGLAVTGFYAFWTRREIPHAAVAVTWLVFPALVIILRGAARLALSAAGLWRLRVLVIGTGETSRVALEALRSQPRLGYDPVNVVSSKVLDTFHAGERLVRLLEHFGADLLILAVEPEDWPNRAVIQSLIRTRIPFAVMRAMDGLPVMGCEQTSFFACDTVMMSYRNNLAKPIERAAKVVFDVTLASVALLILSPLFLFIAIAVKADGGPVFFAHKRIGADGRTFKCLKFRSMVLDSERVLRDVLARDPNAAREWSETQKLRRDPRITRVGAVLRSTSLDELPQLLNVLRLEMSLVGPRPIVDAEVPKYADDIAFYCETRPGITGLWQVSGRSDTSYTRRVQLDSWYVKNWTVWYDVAIIAKTLPAVLKRRGAV